MAACALGLLGRSASVLAASTRSTLGRATLATAQSTEGQSNPLSWDNLTFTPISHVPGTPPPELAEISPEDLAYVTGAALPELNKKPLDEADAFACKIGQRLLYGFWDHLRPDIPRLREKPGVEINATSFLLPLPEHIQPNPKLAAELAKQKKGRKEFRRQEQLNAGRLNARFGESETWKKIKQRLAQGYQLEQALILHYYERYGAPKTIEERRVTLADIFNRTSDWDWILDRDMYDVQNWRELPNDEDFAGLDDEKRSRLVESFKVQSEHPTYEAYIKLYQDVVAEQKLPSISKIPSWKEIEQMPEAERIKHTHAKTEYNKVFEAPLRVGDKFFAFLETAPAFLRKILHAHMKKYVAATEERMNANDNDPRFPRSGAARKRGEHINPELAAKYQALWHRLGHPEEFDDYKDDLTKITNPDLKRLVCSPTTTCRPPPTQIGSSCCCTSSRGFSSI